MNPLIFMIVYGLAFYLSFMNPHIQKRLSQGPTSAFQDKMGKYGDLSLVVLIILIAGPFIPSFDWRMIWLGALLATGIHFFIFYFVHGASMIVIGILCTLIAAAGMMMKDVPFEFFGFADGGVKLIIGCYLLFWSRPTRS